MGLSKLLTKKNRNDFIVFLVVILGITIYVGKLQYDEIQKIQEFHCKGINEDITRPEERECTKVTKLNGNTLVFETKGGVSEKYLVQEVEGKPVYIFDEMIKKEEK